ncbi:hypothetical protein ACEN9F_13280 [Duganella sp. CT11-25]|uniref:hypothetical protein n=1 Tax=unclassified Duganella TaxID=2636909 RepID=UPI0039AEA5A8
METDVGFIAGMIIDKFAYHQPLYRQYVKLQDSGISRPGVHVRLAGAPPCLLPGLWPTLRFHQYNLKIYF